jgi:hypothetical protein
MQTASAAWKGAGSFTTMCALHSRSCVETIIYCASSVQLGKTTQSAKIYTVQTDALVRMTLSRQLACTHYARRIRVHVCAAGSAFARALLTVGGAEIKSSECKLTNTKSFVL